MSLLIYFVCPCSVRSLFYGIGVSEEMVECDCFPVPEISVVVVYSLEVLSNDRYTSVNIFCFLVVIKLEFFFSIITDFHRWV